MNAVQYPNTANHRGYDLEQAIAAEQAARLERMYAAARTVFEAQQPIGGSDVLAFYWRLDTTLEFLRPFLPWTETMQQELFRELVRLRDERGVRGRLVLVIDDHPILRYPRLAK